MATRKEPAASASSPLDSPVKQIQIDGLVSDHYLCYYDVFVFRAEGWQGELSVHRLLEQQEHWGKSTQ